MTRADSPPNDGPPNDGPPNDGPPNDAPTHSDRTWHRILGPDELPEGRVTTVSV